MSEGDESDAASLTQKTVAVSYRPDIDGLRAVAVLAVVLFHFGVEPFGAGFVGVDVFFVISGFLITGLLHKEIVEERFSLSQFYVRRIKRILPALLVVTLCTLGAGAVLLLPSDLERLAEQSAYAIVGLSNFHFFFESGYFDRAAEFLPLLHTWSLGVEEQFYLFGPH
ncbi:MAG: peptidoglycan/LPS O-acetylase OafA/YrhL [Planctomycetota bacterium]